jgi:transcriptional regulator with XRE-family HTH domain
VQGCPPFVFALGYGRTVGQREQATAPINLEALRLVRAAFADSGMTQDQLSRASGLPRSTLANILSPTAMPRLLHVNQLVLIAVSIGADPRVWVGELEKIERQRRGESLTRRRAAKRPAPEVQRRAARSRAGQPPAGG